MNDNLAEQMQAYRTRAEKADAACAAKDEALRMCRDTISNLHDSKCNSITSARRRWGRIEPCSCGCSTRTATIAHALSTDCGKDYVHRSELTKAQADGSEAFATLRRINVQRCESVFHKLSDWTPAEWACAMAGEAGEACNVAKKIKRLETGTNTAKDPQTLEECKKMMGDELADTIIYADLLAATLGINLWEAIIRKFNEVSDRMKTDIKLPQRTDCGKEMLERVERLRSALISAEQFIAKMSGNGETDFRNTLTQALE